ncbi:MAG: signal peptidase II [Deltaproteobacteria bacterium]|nr:signal peptidase II [Deltaproteobacteria bacterium]
MSFFPPKAKSVLVLCPAAACLALDLLTKAFAKAHLDAAISRPVTGFLNLVLTHNPGAAFSLFSGDGQAQGLKMAGLALLSMIPLFWFYRLAGPRDRGTLVSLGLVVGGALGNVHDRLRYGAVVDFLDFHLGDRHWPAFNVADAAICVGLGLLIVLTVRSARREPRTGQAKPGRGDRLGRKGAGPKNPTRI